MIEIANLFILSLLVVAVAWLLYDRRKVQGLIEDHEREDLVTQTELDGYHHRVVQLYQTHRDWSRGKFEEIEHHYNSLRENNPVSEVEAHSPVKTEGDTDEDRDKPKQEALPASDSPIQTDPSVSEVKGGKAPKQPFEAIPETDSFSTAEDRVLEAWVGGASIDEIARDLRMGRQEVQLLIQVSRGRPVGPVKG